MTVSARLAELGIELPSVAAPVAAYVAARVHGDLVHTSGQLPFVAGSLPATGKVGAEITAEDAKALSRTCALNAIAAAADAAGGVDRLGGVLRVGGFVASDPSFSGQPGVINGASEVLGEIFGDAGRHVRAAVGVAVLPLDSPVEVEVTFTLV
ncbi:RidA family protein [Microbacterium capsulatum]|uniref:RidA family protein n=1 Tax=Microbacterium capsulatum TaxID=3041921 RepID=A0ABU0XH44_9MICO|nr:RidA family protein [Microbacterium sp. ASV81]MDQ4214386.1 RidA family protein [Microbacterium sp. ASV81]